MFGFAYWYCLAMVLIILVDDFRKITRKDTDWFNCALEIFLDVGSRISGDHLVYWLSRDTDLTRVLWFHSSKISCRN